MKRQSLNFERRRQDRIKAVEGLYSYATVGPSVSQIEMLFEE